MEANQINSTPLTVKAGEFSWSVSRRNCFEFCPRAYFYRYYAAGHGWDLYSSPELKLLYLLKNIKKADNWLHQLLVDTIRKVYTKPRKDKNNPQKSADILVKQLLKTFHFNRQEILEEKWQIDPKNLNLSEIYYKITPLKEEYFDSKKKKIISQAANFANSLLAEEIWNVPYLEWKNSEKPINFYIDGIKIWCSPDLVWQKSCGTTHVINFNFHPDKTDFDTTFPAITTLMVKSLLRNSQNIIYRQYSPEDNTVKEIICSEEKLGEIRNIISDSSNKMLKLIRSDSSVHENDFNKNPACKPENPLNCEFRKYCFKNR